MGKLKTILRYLLARLTEPSTYKGMLAMISALGGAWTTHKFNPADPVWLEAITWGGLFLMGAMQAALPQSVLYSSPPTAPPAP